MIFSEKYGLSDLWFGNILGNLENFVALRELVKIFMTSRELALFSLKWMHMLNED